MMQEREITEVVSFSRVDCMGGVRKYRNISSIETERKTGHND